MCKLRLRVIAAENIWEPKTRSPQTHCFTRPSGEHEDKYHAFGKVLVSVFAVVVVVAVAVVVAGRSCWDNDGILSCRHYTHHTV